MSHDDQIRDLLLGSAPTTSTPDPVARVRRRLRRRSMTVAATSSALAVTGIATVAMALGGGSARDAVVAASPTPAPVIADVPFVARAYPPFDTTPPETPSEPFCSASSLALSADTSENPTLGFGPQRVRLTVRLKNTGDRACQVPLRGQVELRDRVGSQVASGRIGQTTLELRPHPPAVPPGGTAVLAGRWAEFCAGGDRPTAVHMVLEAGNEAGEAQALSGPLDGGPTPACTNDGKTVNVGGPVGLYELVVMDVLDRRVDRPSFSLTARLVDVPTSVAPGAMLKFGVELHNPTRGPISLSGRNCPLYAALLNRPGRDAHPAIDGAMNCQDAPEAIPAGASVVFRYEFSAPASPGDARDWILYWNRTDAGATQLQAPVRVETSSARGEVPAETAERFRSEAEAHGTVEAEQGCEVTTSGEILSDAQRKQDANGAPVEGWLVESPGDTRVYRCTYVGWFADNAGRVAVWEAAHADAGGPRPALDFQPR